MQREALNILEQPTNTDGEQVANTGAHGAHGVVEQIANEPPVIERAESMAAIAKKRNFLELPQIAELRLFANPPRQNMVSQLNSVSNISEVTPRPTLFLLTSGHHLSEIHCHFSATAFADLGWHVVRVLGVNKDKTHVPKGSGVTSWVGWACGALPKLCTLMQAEGMTDSSVFAVAEDSAWPTTSCTPQKLLDVYRQAIERDPKKRGVWCGASKQMKRRSFECIANGDGTVDGSASSSTHAPNGSKLFVGNRLLWYQMYWLFRNTACNWTVDAHWQLMAASEFVKIRTPWLAGSLPHYSARTEKFCDDCRRDLDFESAFWMPDHDVV